MRHVYSVLVWLVSCGAVFAQDSMLLNGQFSEAGSSATRPAYWDYGAPDAHGSNWGSLARVDWRTHPSTDSVWCAAVRGTWAGAGSAGGLWQEVPAAPGTTYCFSAWAFADNGWAPTAQVMFIRFYDGNTNLLAGTNKTLREVGAYWQRFMVDAEAPTNAAWVRVGLEVSGVGASGAMSLDDFRLWAVSNRASWSTLPARTDDTPGFVYQASPTDWRDINIYQLITDRFNDGDPSNNTNHPGANSNPADPRGIHGGDFVGIEQRLDYIQGLGARAIWISPVFKNVKGEYHGYAAEDFNAIETHQGTLGELRSLVDAAHAKGIYVVLDVVANHMGPLLTATQPSGYPGFNLNGYDLAWEDPTNRFAPPFDRPDDFHNFGEISQWETNPEMIYGDFFVLDSLKTESPQVRRDLIRIYQALIAATDCDGFRVDTAKHVEMDFWEQFLPAIEGYASALGKTNFLLTAECNYGDGVRSGSFSGSNRFNSVLNHPMYNAMKEVFVYGWGTYQLKERLDILTNYSERARYQLVNFLDNHDEARIQSRENMGGDWRMKPALLFLYTGGQVPCLYYGTEQGFDGLKDIYAREDMFDGRFETEPSRGDNFNPVSDLYRFVQKLNELRDAYPALRRGDIRDRWNSGGSQGLFVLSRVLGSNEVVVALNTSWRSITSAYEGVGAQTTFTNGIVLADLLSSNTFTVGSAGAGAGQVALEVPAYGCRVLVRQSEQVSQRPAVTFVYPAHDARGVPLNSPIYVVFDQPMNTNSSAELIEVEPPLAGTAQWYDSNLLVFFPSEPLAFNTRYSVRVRGTATATHGLPLGHDLVYFFSTTPEISVPAERFIVAETSRWLEVTFVRDFSSSSMQFDVRAEAGAARPAVDYIFSTTTVRMEVGETAKTVRVWLVDDEVPEALESFSLVLENPVDVFLREPSRSVVWIKSDDGLILDESLDANPGWAGQGQWAFGAPKGALGGSHGKPNPAAAFTGTNIYGYNLDGGYVNSMTSAYYLTTAPMDCRAYWYVALNFQRWLGVEDSYYDHATIQVSVNDQDWTTVWENPGEEGYDAQTDDGAWTNQTLDLSSLAAGKNNVRIRWGMGPTDAGWTFCGWNLDDIVVFGRSQALLSYGRGVPDVNHPGQQNGIGEYLDFDDSYWVASGKSEGGFGVPGQIYMGLDETNLYLAGEGLDVGASGCVLALFLGLDTLNKNADNLWNLSGKPNALDFLHNVGFEPPVDVAILLGDEWGDDTHFDFAMHGGSGTNMGQGVFFLGPSSFSSVPGARISQYDGSGQAPTVTNDDDGNQWADRWEVAIPLAALGVTNLDAWSQCYLSGLMLDPRTSNANRFVSGNYLGSSAESADGLISNNFEFGFVHLEGYPLRIPVSLVATAGPHGVVSPGGYRLVARGSTNTIQLVSDPYYHLATLWTNSGSITGLSAAASVYTWSNVFQCSTLRVEFAENLVEGRPVPEWWLARYGLTNDGSSFGSAATNDQDADGFSAWQEYLADTDPGVASSRFSITGLQVSAGSRLYFLGSTHRVYRLEQATNGGGPWLDAGPVPVFADGPVSLVVSNEAGSAFYRLTVGLEYP